MLFGTLLVLLENGHGRNLAQFGPRDIPTWFFTGIAELLAMVQQGFSQLRPRSLSGGLRLHFFSRASFS